ncbi:MAG: VCBS repeat-containing protein [Nannocystaceae bacterium]|nr:VCBS repeat-containing protein [Nannocystaceae bacterium]
MMLLSKKFAVASVFAALVVPSVASAGGSMFEVVPGALNPQLCGGTGCWTNHLRVTDIDGDGDLDAIFVNYGDFFGGGASPEPLAVYENDGSGTFANVSASAVAGLETNAHQICIGDVDGDGDGDIYVPDGTGTVHRLMINDGAGVYVDEADGRLPAAVPSSGACRFGDLDGDGDLDLVVSDGYGNGMAALLLYENDGMGVFTEVPGAFSGAIAGQEIDDIEIFDADRDFDLDVFANAHEGGFGGYYLNDGTGALEGQSFPPPQAGGTGYHYNSALCDVDGDGDLDMWIDTIGAGSPSSC